MPYNSEQIYVSRTFNEIEIALLQKFNTTFSENYSLEDFRGTGYYKTIYPMLRLLQQFEEDNSSILTALLNYFQTKKIYNIVNTFSTITGFELSLEQLKQSGVITDYSFGTNATDEQIPLGKIGLSLDYVDTLENKEAIKKWIIDKCGFVGWHKDNTMFKEQVRVITRLGHGEHVVNVHNIETKEMRVKVFYKLDPSVRIKMSPSEITNQIVLNFNKLINSGSKFAIYTLKEGLYGFKEVKLTVSLDGSTYLEDEYFVITKKFYEKIIINKEIEFIDGDVSGG